MVKAGHKRVIRKIRVPSLGSRITWICIYYMRVINQSTGGCDHGLALSLLSYCHYTKVFVTRPMMDTVC
jgi:hypothetical protein